MLKTLDGYKRKSYVGYSTNIKNRLKKHNSSSGAKSTRGYKWKVIYIKKFLSKIKLILFLSTISLMFCFFVIKLQ